MRMSPRGRFAVSAMIDVALHAPQGPVSLAAIGARQRVSLSYMEQLFSRLRRDGLVQSTRGPGGGYTLNREADDISAADILLALDETEGEAAERGLELDLWQRVDDKLLEYLRTVSLRTLVEEQRAKGLQPAPRPTRRPMTVAAGWKALRSRAPNSVFAFGRSFAEA